MPLLAFQCDLCGHVFDTLVSSDRAKDVVCEECAGEVARHYQGKSLFGMIGKEAACRPMGDCPHAGTGCGHACRH